MSDNRRILLVDDEAPLLRLMKTYLERLGYRAAAYETAGAALEHFRAEPAGFSVAIVDLVLPDMPGQELGRALLRLHPELRILVCSGYPFDIEELPEEIQPRFAHLQKPYLPKGLVQAVEELLSR